MYHLRDQIIMPIIVKSNIAGIILTIIPSMSTDFEAEADQSPASVRVDGIISTPRIKQGV
jgi:hypothetical protein